MAAGDQVPGQLGLGLPHGLVLVHGLLAVSSTRHESSRRYEAVVCVRELHMGR